MGSATYEVEEEFAFLGRTFTEYCRLFDLSAPDIAGRRVLDVAAGPSAFTAVASTITEAMAVDPAYGPPADALEAVCAAAVDDATEQLQDKRESFVWDYYGDVETRGRYLQAATRRFLADYAHHPGRYVAAGLPDLPFEQGSVDLALVANFLFLYDDRLPKSFHVEALHELARVAREVRVFPLHGLDGTRSDLVEPVSANLRSDGLSVTCRPVPYEFQPGATEMLVVRTRS